MSDKELNESTALANHINKSQAISNSLAEKVSKQDPEESNKLMRNYDNPYINSTLIKIIVKQGKIVEKTYINSKGESISLQF